MEITQFIILGLGGQALADTHGKETARVLNLCDPDHIRILTLGVKSGSGLDQMVKDKTFILPTEAGMIKEQRMILETLDGIHSDYANHHGVDLLLEIQGRLPQDKERLLTILDRFISLNPSDQTNFTLGRRLGYYRQLSDMNNTLQYEFVEHQVEKIRQSDPDSFETIFHDLRKRVI